jgi:hypothetical protein
MYFDENVSSEKVNAVVNEINRYHFENDKEYNVE